MGGLVVLTLEAMGTSETNNLINMQGGMINVG